MLTEERYKRILEKLRESQTVSISTLVQELNTSESTIRRDLNALDNMGKLIKVHGGATTIDTNFTFIEHNVETKEKLFIQEKNLIGKYASATLNEDDFIFIDAGTTTERMIDFISVKNITVVTNGFTHAEKLAKKGLNCYILGGHIKNSTEAIIGSECVMNLQKYNFTKCFLGTNGISLNRGFTTPDIDEANIKMTAIKNSFITYVLADHSKFDEITSVSFAPLDKACIITDKVLNEKYLKQCTIKEVLK